MSLRLMFVSDLVIYSAFRLPAVRQRATQRLSPSDRRDAPPGRLYRSRIGQGAEMCTVLN
jgi:hypothetical protein